MKFLLSQINPIVGDLKGNRAKILAAYHEGIARGADLVILPECALTGYPLEDLVMREDFMEATRLESLMINDHVLNLADEQYGSRLPGLLFGLPIARDGKVFNAAVLVDRHENDQIQVALKHELPNYGVFDEYRTFASEVLENIRPMTFHGRKLGVMICEDMWHENVAKALMNHGAEVLIVLNGSPFEADKQKVRYDHAFRRAKETALDLIYVNLVGGQDELVFDGSSFCLGVDYDFSQGAGYSEFPVVYHQMARFQEGYLLVEMNDNLGDGYQEIGPMTFDGGALVVQEENSLETIYNSMVVGLRDYVNKNGFEKVLLGVSGGVDSALVAAVAVDALGAENVLGVRLPSKFSSDHSLSDAADLCCRLNMAMETIEIAQAYDAISGNSTLVNLFARHGRTEFDITEENEQARIRGLFLMAISNKLGYMLLSTGNKSEVSVGYATLYGDMNGGFNPIKDCYKTTVFALCEWRNANIPHTSIYPVVNVIPGNIITKPPSAELRPGQHDSDSLPDYPVLDAILRGVIDGKQSTEEVVFTLMTMREIGAMSQDDITSMVLRIRRLIGIAEYKRRQACPGVKTTGMIFGRDRRVPITNAFR